MSRLLAVAGVFVLCLGLASAGAGGLKGATSDTHGRDATPDYARVFAQDVVKRLDIAVTAGDWDRLVADMTEMAGPYGARGGGPAGADSMSCPTRPRSPRATAGSKGTSARSARRRKAAAARCCRWAPGSPARRCLAADSWRRLPRGRQSTWRWRQSAGTRGPASRRRQSPGGNVGRDDVEFLPRTPIYIPATLTFDGISFSNIGLRLKGNSSLLNSWRSGAEKLPFRLNADGLEDQLPDVRDQTFFGFPNLNLTNNSQDASFLRAKVVGDLFREAGVPAARTAFVRVFFDRGAGSRYLGLYTLVEIPDEPMLETQFGSENGNLYKPNGTGARVDRVHRRVVPQEDEPARRGLDGRAGRDRGPERVARQRAGVARAARSAVRRLLVPALAGAQHDHRQHRHVWRVLAPQLLGLWESASPRPALLHSLGSRPGAECGWAREEGSAAAAPTQDWICFTIA